MNSSQGAGIFKEGPVLKHFSLCHLTLGKNAPISSPQHPLNKRHLSLKLEPKINYRGPFLNRPDCATKPPVPGVFEKRATLEGWATCPLTENAFIRIFGALLYPCGPGSTPEARRVLSTFRAAPSHQFWPDDPSPAHPHIFPDLPASPQLTDLDLLALAVKHGGKLATFEQHLDPALLTGGAAALHLIAP